MKQELFVMVDCEYSGDNPGDYSLLSIGAVLVGAHKPPYLKGFYVELMPLNDRFIPEAMAVNKLDFERLKKEGMAPAAAMLGFSMWVGSVVPAEFAYPVMVSDGTADFMWISWYFAHFQVFNPFKVFGYNPGGNTLDLKSFAMGKHPTLKWVQTRRTNLVKKFPEYQTEFTRTHHAQSDAIEQAERFQKMRAL
jgi:ribonuclease T